MSTYIEKREALTHNPGLHLNWTDALVIDPIFDAHPEKKQMIIEQLEKVQETRTGQEMLKEIMQRPDKNDPVTITYVQRDIQPFAVYDSYTHTIEVTSAFFETGFESMVGRTRDQYMVHELGHAAEFIDGTYRNTHYTKMADFLFHVGEEEAKAEKWADKYDEEKGLKHPDYITTTSAEKLVGVVPNAFAAETLTRDHITQGVINGQTSKEIIKSLDESIEVIKKTSGVDLSKEVYAFLNGPPPEFDYKGHIKPPTHKLTEPASSPQPDSEPPVIKGMEGMLPNSNP